MAIIPNLRKKFSHKFRLSTQPKHAKNQKGFAIIFVLAFVALLITVIGDIVYQTQIVAKNSMQAQNTIQAKGAALTGLSIAKVLIKFNEKGPAIKKQFGATLPTKLYSTLNGQRIGAESLQALESLGDEVIDPNLLAALKQVPGFFTLNVQSENCKFNINSLLPPPSPEHKAFTNIFTTRRAQELLQIYRVADVSFLYNNVWLQMSKHIGAGGLISLEELRNVDGFQYDDIYNVYSPYLTVWPSTELRAQSKINMNCADIALIASIVRTQYDTDIQQSHQSFWGKKFIEKTTGDTASLFKNQREINTWFKDNGPDEWKLNGELVDEIKSVLQNFDVKDNVFRIESVGNFNGTKQKLTVVIRYDETTKKYITEYNQWSH